jgi:hypothetical protein
MGDWRNKCMEYPNIMFGRALANSRNRAKKRGIDFDLSREYIKSLFDEQDGKCYYSGIPLNIVKESAEAVHDPLKMTLDCIDPAKGYIKGNVVWCAYCVNAFKQKMNTDQMVEICKEIVKTSSI